MSAMRRTLMVVLILLALPATSWAQRFAPRPRTPAPRFTPGPHVVPLRSSGGAQSGDNDWIWWVIAGVFGSVVIGVLIAVLSGRQKTVRIRITGTPPGEAPEHVRAAWVGLELPLLPGQTGPRTVEQVEVLSMQKTGAEAGYMVDGKQAVALLAEHSPDAAAWWQ